MISKETSEGIYNILFTQLSIYQNRLSDELKLLQDKYIQNHNHIEPYKRNLISNGKRKIGFISADYIDHPVGYFYGQYF